MSKKTVRIIEVPDDFTIKANNHAFNVSLAETFGLVEAILLQYFYYWHECNEDNKDMVKDGRVWFFRSLKQIADGHPYLSIDKIRGALERLIASGFVIKGDYNEDKIQRSSWYSLSDRVLSMFGKIPSHLGKSQAIWENPKQSNIKEVIKNNKEKEELRSSKESASKTFQAEEVKTWSTDFETYKAMVNDAKEKLKADMVYRSQMEDVHNNVDYDKTLDNMVYSYWGLEEAWQKKKKTKSKNIDMVSTLKKNFDKNLIFKPRTYNTPKYTPSIAAEPIKKEDNPRINNDRGDGTWIEGGYVYYENTKSQIECINLPSKDVPMRPDDRHDWYTIIQRWAICNADGTIIINKKRWYQSYKTEKWINIPMDAPEMDRFKAEYNPQTNSWEL